MNGVPAPEDAAASIPTAAATLARGDVAAAYTVIEGDVLRDRAHLLSVWRGTLGESARMAAKFDWFYAGAPTGPALFKLLRHDEAGGDDAVAGACALGRRRMRWGARTIEAGLLVDFAVAAGHRSLGPALLLQQSLLATARERLDAVYGFPNPKAVPIFKRLGWRRIVDMVRYTRVLRHGPYLRRRMPALLAVPMGWLVDIADRVRGLPGARAASAFDAVWGDAADARMDDLWAIAPKSATFLGARDLDTLRWRFDRCPLARTRYLLVSDRAGVLAAWFATQAEGGTLHVRDAWSRDGDEGVARVHVEALIRAARRAGYAALSMQLATDSARTRGWRACRFVERDRRPVYGVLPDIRESDPAIAPYLTAADEDE